MSYHPQEGVDYIVDLYQVAVVPQDAAAEDIKHALNTRTLEYHPDRLEGLAPEFKTKGERIARLLNQARTILLDPEKRREYDEILGAWDGPISTDGTPVIRMDDMVRTEMAQRTPEEIEGFFAVYRKQVADMVRHNPKQQSVLARMLKVANPEDADDLREGYDAALLAEDQVLAIEEAERGRLLGLASDKRYETSLGYAESTRLSLDGAKEGLIQAHQRRTVGAVSLQLAILAGETPITEPAHSQIVTNDGLPHYFDTQSMHIARIASQREELLKERLAIFRPSYLIAELQTEAQPNFVIGIKPNESRLTWIGFHFDKDTIALTNVGVPSEIEELLTGEEFEEVYGRGFNLLTFTVKEHINLNTLLEEACNKHVQRYFPGVLG